MPGMTNEHARNLRKAPTAIEKVLWRRLGRSQLGGHKVRRQQPIGPYIVDFYCSEKKLVIEVDGGQHGGERDAARTAWLESRGYHVIRFWNNEALDGTEGVLSRIDEALDAR